MKRIFYTGLILLIELLTPEVIYAQSLYSTPYSLTTLAGNTGVAGLVNAAGVAAQFNFPAGIVVGPANSIYVADQFNGTIRKINAAGVVTNYVTGSAGKMGHPTGLAIDSSGVLYVADPLSQGIYSVSTSGVVTLFAGGTGVGATNFGDSLGCNGASLAEDDDVEVVAPVVTGSDGDCFSCVDILDSLNLELSALNWSIDCNVSTRSRLVGFSL